MRQLVNIGRHIEGIMPEQQIIDQILAKECGYEK
jgi:hypothetical protein